MRDINWSARRRTVLRLKRRLQKLNKSSSDGPRRSITCESLEKTLCVDVTHHGVVVALPAEPAYEGYTDTACECFVYFSLSSVRKGCFKF